MNNKEKLKGVHISFDLVNAFVPRIPKQRCPKEDNTIPRICVSNNIYSAINAIPQAGQVISWMKKHNLPVIIHAYYLTGSGMNNENVKHFVPDAEFTHEFWLTEIPDSVYRVDYEILDFQTKKITDRYGHDLVAVWGIQVKRCKYQDNVDNFLKQFGRNGVGTDRQKKVFADHSYRTVISNLFKEEL